MNRRNFRTPFPKEIRSGLAIWLDGRHFFDTNPIGPKPRDQTTPVCGPFLVERVLFESRPEPRVDLIDPQTGDRRSMMCSWILVPRENK